VTECRFCGARVPAGSRYCPECGRPAEAGAAPTPERPWPLDPFVLLAVLVALGGIALLAGRVWAWGVAVLLVAALVLLARRKLGRPHGRRALLDARLRAQAVGEALAVRSRGQVELFRARRDLAELDVERNRRLRDLGQAVFDDDETGMKGARAAVEAVVDRIREKEAEIQALIRSTEERVRRAHAAARPTELLEPQGPIGVPEPTPPVIPEPTPPVIPEPYPPPDEGTPPAPARIPEPTPDPGPEPPSIRG
jgi:hypothetical protein